MTASTVSDGRRATRNATPMRYRGLRRASCLDADFLPPRVAFLVIDVAFFFLGVVFFFFGGAFLAAAFLAVAFFTTFFFTVFLAAFFLAGDFLLSLAVTFGAAAFFLGDFRFGSRSLASGEISNTIERTLVPNGEAAKSAAN